MEYSHDGPSQKPVKHCSLKTIFYVLITKDFACTKYVLTPRLSSSFCWDHDPEPHWEVLCEGECTGMEAGHQSPICSLWMPLRWGGDGHWGSLQAPADLSIVQTGGLGPP